MEKYRAIPPGFMTVGELAKKMNTTVRTLQYYDREGLLSPSAASGGGRRLYAEQAYVSGFIEPALGYYFTSNGINPFEGVQT